MSILDDAIREHLELKRQHGADESELKRLEDEAFGPPERPGEADPFAEAPTEFMAAPEASGTAEESGGRRINITDLQEPPEPEAETKLPEDIEPLPPAEDAAQAEPPVEEEQPAMEHEVVPEAEGEPSSFAEDRQEIAEQPTELFDVEAEIGTEDAPAAAPSPSDEEIVEAELSEPKLTPVEPASEIHASRAEPAEDEKAEEEYEEDEEFWSEQRLSDELDQALESPLTDEHELEEADDFEEEKEGGPADESDDFEPDSGHDDVLEDTPDFLEDAPEDDELWFEQKPPKDFDFDD